MPHHTRQQKRRRRRSWPRILILLCFLAAAIAGIIFCFFRKPTVPPEEPPASSEAVSSEDPSAPDTSRERKKDFFTILVSGVDDGNGGSDTNILVGFDAEGDTISCVSIPRDSGMYVNGKGRKINSAYNLGGTELLADSVSDALGIPVDFTVEVDLTAFVQLVDAIGGVDFDVPVNMDYDDPYQDLHIHLSKGYQHLDGKDAINVVRFRHNNDGSGYGTEDIGRIGTQQAFLKAVAKKMLTLSNVNKVGTFAKIFRENVDTDLSAENLAWLGKEAVAMGLDKLSFSTLPGEWSSRLNLWVLDPEETLNMVNTSLNPYAADRTAEDLHLVG